MPMESPESWFHNRATLYVEAQILFHLNQAGVWSLLKRGGAHTAPQIASSRRPRLAATDALLDYVFQVDRLLERDDQDTYSLSEFGRQVVERFSDAKGDAGQDSINMFDVRVGAYGPVWQNLGRMLSGDGRYGEDFQREGRYAENGVFKLAMRFWDSLVEPVDELGVARVVEVGLTTGLVEKLGEKCPGHRLYGLDRSEHTLERNAARAAARNVTNIQWLRGDYFDVERWSQAVDAGRPGLIFSLHFHELIAAGEERFREARCRVKSAPPGWAPLAFSHLQLSAP